MQLPPIKESESLHYSGDDKKKEDNGLAPVEELDVEASRRVSFVTDGDSPKAERGQLVNNT